MTVWRTGKPWINLMFGRWVCRKPWEQEMHKNRPSIVGDGDTPVAAYEDWKAKVDLDTLMAKAKAEVQVAFMEAQEVAAKARSSGGA